MHAVAPGLARARLLSPALQHVGRGGGPAATQARHAKGRLHVVRARRVDVPAAAHAEHLAGREAPLAAVEVV